MYTALRDALMKLMAVPLELPRLPFGSGESVRVCRASPRYLLYRITVWLIVLVIVAAIYALAFVSASLAGKERAVMVLLMVSLPLVAIFAAVYFLLRLDYDLRTYVITDRSLRVRSGALVVREQTVSYANVQNLEVVQGPLQRFFNIWDLRVETAGGGSAAGDEGGQRSHGVIVAGLEDAHALRDQVLGYMRREAGHAGLGDLDDGTGRAAALVRGELEALVAEARNLRAASERSG